MLVMRASPVQMRKSLEVVDALKRAGVWFVPIPVLDEAEFNERISEMANKLEEIEQANAGA